jgi:hypothetical protein
MRLHPIAFGLATLGFCLAASAGTITSTQFVNGLALDGGAVDLSTGTNADRRQGYFSDLYYDPQRKEWWGLSDRGPGGGVLNYETRIQRFTLDIAPNGAISNYQVQQTIKFNSAGSAMNGLAPSPTSVLGNALDPEGIVIHPKSGNLLVSDEYGPSLIEFDRAGNLVRRFTTPANLVPRNAGSGTPNFAGDAGNTAGKRTNRGFEGLAISPDGRYVYAMLQSAMLDEGGAGGVYARIVKFSSETGEALAQYAYRMDTSAQGRGISALVALGDDRFLVLERNNRGIGVGATLAAADKAVYQIDLAGAVDVTNTALPATGAFAGAVQKIAKRIDLDADTLAALGNQSPEKWEGLTVGPQLADGRFLMLAGTDADYSVTQDGPGTQFDVWFDFSLADPYANSIQCPIGTTLNCFNTNGGAAATLDTGRYALLPGVLHAYAVGIDGYVTPMSAPASLALALLALGLLGAQRRRGAQR